MCTTHPGKRPSIPRPEVKRIVDVVFREIGQRSVDKKAFLTLVDAVCAKTLGGHFVVIRISEFNSWGYEVVGDRIQRKSK
jgi:hypothetical protein